MNSVYFWLGLVVSIPVGIAANLLTPVIQDQVARRSRSRSQKRLGQLRAESNDIDRLRNQPSAATAYVGALMLKTVLPSALAATFSIIAVLLPTDKAGKASVYQYLASAAGLITLIVGAYTASRAVALCHGIYDAVWYAKRRDKRLKRLVSRFPPG